ncbi:MAG: type II secretion system protein N [Burkholderiaceae bacterium]
MIRRKRKSRFWSPTVAGTGWGDSTYAEMSWDKSRGAATRWALAGVVFGVLAALIAFAPAAWLARAVASATDERVLLADARGTVWSGSAVAVLTGGPGSRDASSLPGRIEWTLGLQGLGLALNARHACCLNGTVTLQVRPGFGRFGVTLVPPPGWVGQWPSAFLGGLGTPWNTLQLGGVVRLVSPALKLESAQGRWVVEGRADMELVSVSSRLTTLETLGSYKLTLTGDAATPGTSQLSLSTQDGALQLSGQGTWGPGGVRFRGEASAAATNETALSNLLNIIGRRDGAKSVITIG